MQIPDSLSGTDVLYYIGGAAIIIMLIIGSVKFLLRRKSHDLKETDSGQIQSNSATRTKYPDVDVFKFSKYFHLVGFAFSLFVAVVLFNYTQPNFTPEYEGDIEFIDDMVEIRRTKHIKEEKKIEIAKSDNVEIEEVIIEEDKPELMETSVEADTVVFEEVRQTVPFFSGDLPEPAPAIKEKDEPEYFLIAEQMPRFPGCEDIAGGKEEKVRCAEAKLLEFVYSEIKYPSIARDNGIEGAVIASFIVHSDGTIRDVKIIRDIGAGCGQEVKRVISLMNEHGMRWTPGRQREKPVSVQFTLPVVFNIEP